MIDIKLIRKDRQAIETLLKRKDPTIDLSQIVDLDQKIRESKTRVEQLKASRNEQSQKIGELKEKEKMQALFFKLSLHLRMKFINWIMRFAFMRSDSTMPLLVCPISQWKKSRYPKIPKIMSSLRRMAQNLLSPFLSKIIWN